jgi:hypothetical protein
MTVLVLPLIFVFTALTVLVFAFGARRLLGLRFSFLRTLIAGVLAFLIASPVITAISGSAPSVDAITWKGPAKAVMGRTATGLRGSRGVGRRGPRSRRRGRRAVGAGR